MPVAVVRAHPRMGPDHLLVRSVDRGNVLVVCRCSHLNRVCIVPRHFDEARGDVSCLTFGLEDGAATMTKSGVWALHHKHVGEAGHRDTQIRRWVVVGPHVAKAHAIASGDVEFGGHVAHLKASCEHHHIGLAMGAVGRNNAVDNSVINRFSNQFYVWLEQRPEPAVVEQNALAERGIVGQAFVDQVNAVAER